ELQAYIAGTWVDLNGTTNGSFVLVSGDTMTGSLWFSGLTQDIRTPSTDDLVLAPGGQVGIGLTAPTIMLQLSATNSTTTALAVSPGFGNVGIGTTIV